MEVLVVRENWAARDWAAVESQETKGKRAEMSNIELNIVEYTACPGLLKTADGTSPSIGFE